MMKLTLALAFATIFTTSAPALADFNGAETSAAPAVADQAYSPEEALQSFDRPIRRRCFVRDRFRTYNNLRGCYRRSPVPRSCRQVCR
jgi:hypothetical protein